VSLSYIRGDPLQHADGIKRLFAAEGRPEFPDWFDRAYPAQVARGAWSQIALDDAGLVQLHVALIPVAFRCEDREGRALLLSNLMAASAHRNFLSALGLLRRAAQQARDDGADLLFTNPRNDGAAAVLRGAGLKQVGEMVRHVRPTGDARGWLDAGVGVELAVRRVASRARCRAEACDVRDAVAVAAATHHRHATFELCRAPETLGHRNAGLGDGDDRAWRLVDRTGRTRGAVVLRLARNGSHARVLTACADDVRLLGPALTRMGRMLRGEGMHRLETWALQGSMRAAALRRAGFRARPESVPLVAAAGTELGRLALARLGASDLEEVDLD
jgi:hypothetical protein